MSVSNVGTALAFIDTNIWLYAFSSSQDPQKTQRAKLLLRQTPSIAVSTQVINELSFNMLRKFHADEQDIGKLFGRSIESILLLSLAVTLCYRHLSSVLPTMSHIGTV